MPKSQARPILNSTLPQSFRQIRLELARESGHSAKDGDIAYVIVAPLDLDGRIDPAQWKHHRDACRVARLQSGKNDSLGHLVHRPGGSWFIEYDIFGEADTTGELGHHFNDHRFVNGEYVSIGNGKHMHTFRVVRVSRL